MSPASPAAHLVWPIDDLTEPTTQSARRGARVLEEPSERLDLDDVAQGGAGAVRLDVADGARRDAGLCVGALEGAHLPFDDRGGQAAGAAVARGADALDHGVDAVAVALGVGQALEHERGHSLADDDPVGTGVERATAAARRERLGLAERQIGERDSGPCRRRPGPPCRPRLFRARERPGRPPPATSRRRRRPCNWNRPGSTDWRSGRP